MKILWIYWMELLIKMSFFSNAAPGKFQVTRASYSCRAAWRQVAGVRVGVPGCATEQRVAPGSPQQPSVLGRSGQPIPRDESRELPPVGPLSAPATVGPPSIFVGQPGLSSPHLTVGENEACRGSIVTGPGSHSKSVAQALRGVGGWPCTTL